MSNGVYLISACHDGKKNAMIAAWCAPVSFDPAMLTIHISPGRFTHELISGSDEFAVNILAEDQVEISEHVGSCSGRDVDKFESIIIETFKGEKTDAPLVKGCVANIECKVVDEVTAGDHTVFVGKVLSYKKTEKKPLLYHHGSYYGLKSL